MANQYTGNFEQIIRNRFKCSAKEALLKCKEKGLSYYEAEKVLGFKHVTIRKWAKRFDIKLISKLKREKEAGAKREKSLVKHCKEKAVNKTNLFSKTWINRDYYKSIKLAKEPFHLTV